ncbi:MAG: metallophosphoesterase [Deltaproteobacteria bacterium]|nr:metallophosphoesterase [Deltaproteobacteria bacterium]MCB9785849.1 metallophosphoesterase [Deltaproteobacteria bacterium]
MSATADDTRPADRTLVFAHVSDVHVLDLVGVSMSRFLNKRLSGLLNLASKRRNAHPVAILEAIVDDVIARPVDHVLLTGDLTNLALPTEFRRARAVLDPIARPDRLSVVPGNHDIYTRGAARDRRFESFFGDLMWTGADSAQTYPWYKRVGPVHLVGLCSAEPRLPLIATGRVGDRQLQRLTALASTHDLHGEFTIAMVHHNLHARGLRKDLMHGMQDRARVLDACAEAGVDLLLHGHTHVANRFRHGSMRVVGSGSSTWDAEHPDHRARYNRYHVGPAGLERIEVCIWDGPDRGFVTSELPEDPPS